MVFLRRVKLDAFRDHMINVRNRKGFMKSLVSGEPEVVISTVFAVGAAALAVILSPYIDSKNRKHNRFHDRYTITRGDPVAPN